VTTAQYGGKVVSLTHRPPLPPGNTPGTHFCWRLSRLQGHSAIGRIVSTEKSNDTTWNRTNDLPICATTVPRVCNTYSFSTATMVARTCPTVTLHVHCLSYYDWGRECFLRGTRRALIYNRLRFVFKVLKIVYFPYGCIISADHKWGCWMQLFWVSVTRHDCNFVDLIRGYFTVLFTKSR
jgi:hypothetical protein